MEFTATENGDLAFTTTGSKNLDFFTRIVRNAPLQDYLNSFSEAWNEDRQMAIQNLMNLRDVRKGKGEKLIPIVILVYLKHNLSIDNYLQILEEMIKYGCWKDILRVMEIDLRYQKEQNEMTDSYSMVEISLFVKQLQKDYDMMNSGTNIGISLCGKWAPTENTHYDKHPLNFAQKISNAMGLSSRQYRKMLTKLRQHLNILEMLMCTQQYDKIDFSKIPAIAMTKNKKAFNRDHNSEGIKSDSRKNLHMSYEEYIRELTRGTTKVNITGIQPHELVNTYLHNRSDVDPLIENQWQALKNRVTESGSFDRVTAIVDVSGSMSGQPMEVSIALGILVAECTKGPLNGQVLTFSTNPQWHVLEGSDLKSKVKSMSQAEWGGSTDLRKAFKLLLSEAKRYNLNPEQMPHTLFIFTDMQFDSACSNNWSSTFADCKSEYEKNGYKLPKIVCWNLRTSGSKSLPITQNEEGFVMLSGFSAELLKCILNAQEFSPISMLRNILGVYDASCVENCGGVNIADINTVNLQKAIDKSSIKKSYKKK